MKKIRNIGLIMGLMILISSNSNAQYFYSSFGYAQDWNLPRYIGYSIQDNYYGYDIAHVQRYTRHGHTNFNILLHRNGYFVELRYDRHGHIYRTIRHNYYPLMAHRCTNHCGYHHNYYNTYYATYHHKHYKHKHRKTVYVNTHHGYKNHKHNNYYTNVYVEKPQKKGNHYQGNTQYNRQNRSNVNTRTDNNKPRTNGEIRKPQQSNRQAQHNVIRRTNTQQQRSNTVTRKPQPTKRTVEYRRPQGSSNTNRVQQSKTQQRSTRTASTTNRSKSTLAYISERASRDR